MSQESMAAYLADLRAELDELRESGLTRRILANGSFHPDDCDPLRLDFRSPWDRSTEIKPSVTKQELEPAGQD